MFRLEDERMALGVFSHKRGHPGDLNMTHPAAKRRRKTLNDRFDMMVETMKVFQDSSKSLKSRIRARSNASSVPSLELDSSPLKRGPNNPGSSRLNGLHHNNAAPSSISLMDDEPMPPWLADTVCSLGPKNPLRLLLLENCDQSSITSQSHRASSVHSHGLSSQIVDPQHCDPRLAYPFSDPQESPASFPIHQDAPSVSLSQCFPSHALPSVPDMISLASPHPPRSISPAPAHNMLSVFSTPGPGVALRTTTNIPHPKPLLFEHLFLSEGHALSPVSEHDLERIDPEEHISPDNPESYSDPPKDALFLPPTTKVSDLPLESPTGSFPELHPELEPSICFSHTTRDKESHPMPFFFDSPTQAPSEMNSSGSVTVESLVEYGDLEFKWTPFIRTEQAIPRTELLNHPEPAIMSLPFSPDAEHFPLESLQSPFDDGTTKALHPSSPNPFRFSIDDVDTLLQTPQPSQPSLLIQQQDSLLMQNIHSPAARTASEPNSPKLRSAFTPTSDIYLLPLKGSLETAKVEI
ncbi:hypothetical protein DL96DRAFT_1603337 [Flagelloscypha sp. PMI_526]|nr:hypothetical protein DL96DRAFT_1603337 [Flagelloscypha sp. PMI_526]